MGIVQRIKLPVFLAIWQTIFIILFGVWGKYDETADAKYSNDKGNTADTPIRNVYTLFQDVHVMIFVGIGFLYAYLKRHGLTSIGMNMLIGSLIIQWSALVRGVASMIIHGEDAFAINVNDMVLSEFSAAVVLISWGGILGKTSPIQVMVMGMSEIVLYQINLWIAFEKLQIVDLGQSIVLHVFGAYFGMAVARVLYRSGMGQSKKEGSVYHSDIFALVGTVFLWLFWPSFNGSSVAGDSRHRAIINTYYSLSACCIATFALSGVLDKKGKLETSHIQNATLAGGVSIGASAALMVQPWGALTIGALGGVISVIGYKYVSPFLLRKVKLHDTAGIHNLHGMPGILGGVASALIAGLANEDVYGPSLYLHFPAMSPTNVTDLLSLQATHGAIEAGSGRSSGHQAGFQILAIIITLAIAIVGGVITGCVLRFSIWDEPPAELMFDDGSNWTLPESGLPNIEIDDHRRGDSSYHDTLINMV